MTAQLQIKDVANSNIHHTKEPLVLSFKLSLIKDLHSDD